MSPCRSASPDGGSPARAARAANAVRCRADARASAGGAGAALTLTMPCREHLELPVLSGRMRRSVGRFGWRWAGREGKAGGAVARFCRRQNGIGSSRRDLRIDTGMQWCGLVPVILLFDIFPAAAVLDEHIDGEMYLTVQSRTDGRSQGSHHKINRAVQVGWGALLERRKTCPGRNARLLRKVETGSALPRLPGQSGVYEPCPFAVAVDALQTSAIVAFWAGRGRKGGHKHRVVRVVLGGVRRCLAPVFLDFWIFILGTPPGVHPPILECPPWCGCGERFHSMRAAGLGSQAGRRGGGGIGQGQ